ncbi:MAG: glycerophosphodiester phosphodiesterase family protein, partial [Myxococcota bacterium]
EIEAAKAAGFSGVAIRAAELSPEMVSIAHARGLRLRAWGIRDDADVARVLAAGADGMTVDWPDRVPDGLKER